MSALLSLPTRPSRQRVIPNVGAAGTDLSESRTIARLLSLGAIWSLDLQASETVSIHGLSGSGWVTFEGDPVDYILEPGMQLTFTRAGRVVIEAIENQTSVSVTVSLLQERTQLPI